MAKILILDIETAPNVAFVWRFFKEFIGAKQVIKNGYMLSYAAKWLGEDEIYYEDTSVQSEYEMIIKLKDLLEVADIVVAHNGEKFDLPQIAGRYLIHDATPPSPCKIVDTYKVAKKEFAFPSNSLEYLSNTFDVKNKKDNHQKFPGFELWLGVLRKDPEAWAEMKKYNIIDILALEEVYLKMRPFIRNHPNVGVFSDDDTPVCNKCGSKHMHRRGFAYTNTGKYQRFQCQDCGGWSRSRYTENSVEKRKKLLTGVYN